MTVAQIQNTEQWFGLMFNTLNKSRYAVERSFNNMPLDKKRIFTALADLDCRPKFADYSEEERLQLANALKILRSISDYLPKQVTKADFLKLDNKIGEHYAGNN